MKPSKRLAAGMAAAIAVGGLGVLSLGTSAQAGTFGPTSVGLPASLFLSNTPGATNATTNNTYTDTFTLSTSPLTSVNAGGVVTVTLSATTGALTGPVPLSANTQVIRSTVSISGAQTASVAMLDPNSSNGTVCGYPTTPIGTNSPQGAWSTVGTYTASGNGVANVRLNQIFFDDQGNLDGSVANVCAGTANNADYYASAVTQTAGSGNPGIAKTAPVDSTTIATTITHVGPNASQVGNATYQSVPGYVRAGNAGGPPNTLDVNVTLSGTVWDASVATGGFTADWCNASGVSCDVISGGIPNTLQTDVSGNLSGTVRAPSGITTGNRTIKLTQGANTSLTPMVVLATATFTAVPSSGGPGTAVAISGSNWNPTQNITVRGASTGIPTFTATTDTPVVVAASATGTLATSFTVNDPATINLLGSQGTPGAPGASNPAAFTAFTVNQDRCVAYNSNLTLGAGCNTKQNINVSVFQGRLVQRAYVNTTPASPGTDQSAVTSPIVGTSNVNPDATTVNLGTVTVPLAPVTLNGTLNDITVTDNRGGTFGWTLSATMPNFTGVPASTIANNRLSATPACAPATNATAWDYSAVGKTVIAGFDDTLNASGVTAGAAAQNFGGTVTLCTKDTTVNATTQTTGGVYNVTSSLALALPAFQLAAKYTSTITVLLA